MKPSAQNLLLKKEFYDKTTDCVEFNIDNSDLFLELINDLALQSPTSVRKNTMENKDCCWPRQVCVSPSLA